jgi:hypothetical protein
MSLSFFREAHYIHFRNVIPSEMERSEVKSRDHQLSSNEVGNPSSPAGSLGMTIFS